MTSDDIFDDVLNLEEDFYQEGYEHGYRDGAEGGRVEGRSVGMKQGYEKFVEAGRLQGRALVWANRIPRLRSLPPAQSQPSKEEVPKSPQTESSSPSTIHTSSHPGENAGNSVDGEGRHSRSRSRRLPDLMPSNNARLEKNVATLYGMVEPGTLSTQNEDEAVNDFDSRLKGAQGKLKVIERVVGEKITMADSDSGLSSSPTTTGGPKNSNIEDIGRIPVPKQE